MFTIIGGDGKEYGPATTEQVRAWITSGRANLDTKAKALGSDEWRRLGDFVEFSSPDTPPVVSAVPPLTAAPATPGDGDLASAGARIGGALLNALLYFLCMMPGSAMMSSRLLKDNPQLMQGGLPHFEDLNLSGSTANILWIWAGLLLAILVQVILLAVRGQNLGKLATGTRVVRFDTGGHAGFVRAALLRFLIPLVLMFVLNMFLLMGCVFLLVDLCFIFRADRRCLHDLIAGTKVVKVKA